MSRSAPDSTALANPARRWFEWDGENGVVRYYDKPTDSTIVVPLPFEFLLLDELRTIGGWHKVSQSGIYANEVRNLNTDEMIVRAFKHQAGPLASGLYKDIKDKVVALGGHFVTNCYIAFQQDNAAWTLGSLKFKGAALRAWFEFFQNNRYDVYGGAVRITSYIEGKAGRITYRVPVFECAEASSEANGQALALDRTLQQYLTAKLASQPQDRDAHADGDGSPVPTVASQAPAEALDADEVPF